MSSELIDVVVIGAGFAGLAAAKSYMQCAPETNVIIFDVYPTIGGVWSKARIYPTLRSNNQLGTLELPDYKMHEGFGVEPGNHIPGAVVHNYLREYADNFNIFNLIRFNTKVKSAEKLDDGSWKLEVDSLKTEDNPARTYSVSTKKLIIATGLTSQPEAVHYKGEENFDAPVINSAALATEGVRMIEQTSSEDRQITVLGGSKSAYDAVYMFASQGFKVNWVIRQSGYGATWMAPPHIQVGPKRVRVEHVPCTRFLSWFSPCLWGSDASWVRSFLHGTAVGRFVVRKFWNKLGSDILAQSGLNSDPELRKLIPDESCMWYATSLAIINYKESIHDLVTSGRVRVYREDVSHLSSQSIHLASGATIHSPGGLVTATNWQWAPNLELQPANLHAELGIPSDQYSADQKQFWDGLDEQADKVLFARFPAFVGAPQPGANTPQMKESTTAEIGAVKERKTPLEPFRLYRFLAPPGLTTRGDRSVVFVGYVANLLNQVRNEVAGLWAYAYLNDKLEKNDEDVYWQTSLQTRFCRRRYPFGYGNRFPDFVFEQVPYLDLLLQDLGLPHRRKSNWFKDLFEPYAQDEYRGLAAEWLRMQKEKMA
ncbi:hypothetical protein MBLNU459_g3921t1 [Dothideomycetes sp. NU459]